MARHVVASYVMFMNAMNLIELKRQETERKAERLRAELEEVEDELRRLSLTAGILARLKLDPDVDTSVPRSQSAQNVFDVLGLTQSDGKTPKDIHSALLAASITSISLQNVRTIISRHRDVLMAHEGRYWRRTNEKGG